MTYRSLALSIGLGCVLGAPVTKAARAEDAASADAPGALSVAGDCPSRDAIAADAKAMVPASELGKVTAAKIDVSDMGVTYRVRIAGNQGERQRTFRDLDRDCDHR